MFENAEVPLYPELIKTISRHDWTASALRKQAALVNVEKGISPFAMIDISEEAIAVMTQNYEDIHRATVVNTIEFKTVRENVTAQTPASAEEFMLMIKLFAKLLNALFTRQYPLYKQIFRIVKELRGYSLNARALLLHEENTSTLWIILM